MDELKVAGRGELNALDASLGLLPPDNVLFPNDREIGLMGQKREHDQVGV